MERKSSYQPEDFTSFLGENPKHLPPNLKLLEGKDRERAFYMIAHGLRQELHVRAKLDANRPYPEWVTAFHNPVAMGTAPDGSGYILRADWHDGGKAVVYSFAICEHIKTEEGHRPNPSRGWHPGHCEKCGLDMTIDSGD
jgi:hypothetical protein